MSSNQNAWNESGKRNLDAYLKDRCDHRCEHCRAQFTREVLEFHHRDPETKLFSPFVDYWRGMYGVKPSTLEEAEKCMVLCANCHRIEHVRIKNARSDIRHRSERTEANQGVGRSRQRCEYQRSFDFEEPNT